MFMKILARILAAVLILCPLSAALCEEEWPDEIFLEDEDDFFFEDDVLYEPDVAAWYEAMDVYDMFVNCAVSIDYDKPSSDGTMFLVIDERFSRMQDLLDDARIFFSDEIAEELMGAGMYAEEEGLLYGRDTVKYMDENIDDIEVAAIVQDDRVDYDVTIKYLSPNANGNTSETLRYTRELIGDIWRFTVFPSI